MNATLGELATRWTVRAALAGYFLGATFATPEQSPGTRKLGRIAWTLGCLCYLGHVGCAFHFYHHWSHAAAVERTADQTALVTGWRWGGGVYLNYLFTAVWLVDAIVKWCYAARPARIDSRWLGQKLAENERTFTKTRRRPAMPRCHRGVAAVERHCEVGPRGAALPQPPPIYPEIAKCGVFWPSWPEAAVQAFMWFMVFNATAVFGHGLVRWFGLAGCLWLLALAGQRFATARLKR